MKLLERNTCKKTKDENCENIPYLKTIEVVLVHCNIVNNDYQRDSKVMQMFVPKKRIDGL